MSEAKVRGYNKQFRLMQTSDGKQALAIIAHLVAKLGGQAEMSFAEMALAEDRGLHMQFNSVTDRLEIYARAPLSNERKP